MNETTWEDVLAVGRKAKKCGFWQGGCSIYRRDLPNGDVINLCSKCGHIAERISCYDYEMILLNCFTNESDLNHGLIIEAYCNWIPKHPHVKKLWDEYIGYDSKLNHYGHSAQDLAYIAQTMLGKGE